MLTSPKADILQGRDYILFIFVSLVVHKILADCVKTIRKYVFDDCRNSFNDSQVLLQNPIAILNML